MLTLSVFTLQKKKNHKFFKHQYSNILNITAGILQMCVMYLYIHSKSDCIADSNVFFFLFGFTQVVKINPTDGTVLMTFQVPNGTVTSVAFGLEKMDVLFVTTLRDHGTSMPMFGALYRVTDINSTGLDSEPFHLAQVYRVVISLNTFFFSSDV